MRAPPPAMNARRARPVSSSQKECRVEIDTALRIRPLLKKERNDQIVLEAAGDDCAILNGGNERREYRFKYVFPENSSQDKIYNTLGLPIATATMNSVRKSSSSRMPKSHLFISMGAENSGKTFTCFGGATIQKRRAAQDGLVPRLLDTLFSQASGSKGFGVQVSMMHVTQAKRGQSPEIHDLLANSSSKNKLFGSPKLKKNLNVRNMAARFERAMPSPRKPQKAADNASILDAENLKPAIQSCSNISDAREALQNGLSGSEKLTTGSLYVTVQPVVDGNNVGDKICVLEMTGALDESGAVLDCLRVLQQNSNERSSKPVSFRNHKITMMLNPLFRQSSFVNVTLLSAAYPGHDDFREKQMLLNDLQALHSTTQSANAVQDSMSRQTTSNVNDRDDQREWRSDEKSRHTASAPGRDERQNTFPSKDSRGRKSSVKGPPVAIPVATATASVAKSNGRVFAYKQQYQKSNQRTAEPSAPALDEVQETSLQKYGKSKQRTVESSAPAFEDVHDTSSRMFHKPNHPKVEPSAPVFDGQESFATAKKLKERAMDFPGVDVDADRSAKESSRERRYVRKVPETKKEELKNPLGRSSLENCDQSNSTETGKARGGPQRNAGEKFVSQENSRISSSFEADFENFGQRTEHKNDELIRKLQEQLQKTTQEKNALERMCSQLEDENAELRQLSRAAGRTISTKREEEQWEKCRKMRLEAQNAIKAPVQEHLDRVNYIYDIKNQWCMTNKTHFSLRYPDHFQRAPVLDIRDRETEQQEDLKNLNRNEILKTNETETEKPGLTKTRRSTTPPPRMSPQKPAKPAPPTGLSALRRLVGSN